MAKLYGKAALSWPWYALCHLAALLSGLLQVQLELGPDLGTNGNGMYLQVGGVGGVHMMWEALHFRADRDTAAPARTCTCTLGITLLQATQAALRP